MDIKELSGITGCNLDYYRSDKKRIEVGERAHLSVLCRHFCHRSFSDGDGARQYYNRMMSEFCATENERKIFCSLLCDIAKEEGCEQILSAFSFDKPNKNASVIYLRNPLCDIAYDRFSTSFSSLSAEYEASFTQCAQRLYSGDCDYIILPISNEEGRLHAPSKLIDSYELHTVLCTSVHDEINDTDSVFALLSKGIEIFDIKGREFLDIIFADSQKALPLAIAFAHEIGLLPHSIDTLGQDLTNGKAQLVFDVTKKDYRPFLTYTFFEIPRHITQGIYKEI